jgi:hypothetical protein
LQRLERELKALRRACRSAHREAQCAILSELGGKSQSGAQLLPHVRGSHRR